MPLFFRNSDDKSYALSGAEMPSILLLAEGFTEALFLEKWLTQTNHDPSQIAVVCIKGKAHLKTIFRKLADDENFSAIRGIGFFIDAEKQAAKSTVDTIASLLKAHKIIPQAKRLTVGTQKVGIYQIAIFVSPNNSDSGWIENIVLSEIGSTDIASCIDTFSQSVHEVTGTVVHSKTLVQAFLGVRKPGLCATGHGFSQGKLDVMHDAYKDIRAVIGSLF